MIHAVMRTGPARIQAVDLRSDYHGSSQSLDSCVRPIAVGETIRRIVGKVAVELTGDPIRTVLLTAFARRCVRTHDVCEAVIHMTSQWKAAFRDHRNRVTALI